MKNFSCLGKCKLNINDVSFDSLKNAEIDSTIAKIPNNPYRLEFAPVGNSPVSPTVIICGKTPGNDTWKKFLNLYRNGDSIETSSFKSVYSNMKDNLYKYLFTVGLFEYLANINEYWKDNDKKRLWDDIFCNEICSRECGIQLTQACNCAILEGTRSNEPRKRIFDYINTNSLNCFFNDFIITPKLKLIVFLDTPSDDRRFHQIDYWRNSDIGKKASEMGVKTISITHPSGQNNDIYKKLDSLQECDDNVRLKNAFILYSNAIKTIQELFAE